MKTSFDVRVSKSEMCGEISAPPSKSELHRLLILAALCDSPTEILFSGELSDDVAATAGCLAALDAEIVKSPHGLLVSPLKAKGQAMLDCRESGTTLRFMLPLVCALGTGARLVGRGRLPMRPNLPLTDALAAHGCYVSGDMLPISVSGKLQSGRYMLAGNISSQFISGLMTALPITGGESEIVLTSRMQSFGYIQMTRAAMERFGVSVAATENGWRIPASEGYESPKSVCASGDWSNAAFFLVSAALRGEITVSGLDESSEQGDRAILGILRDFGAEVSVSGNRVSVASREKRSITVDATDIPDLVPAMAVLACGAKGKSVIYGVSRLKYKESDRIQSVASLIRSLGGSVFCTDERMEINGTGTLSGGSVNSFSDHRIAMAAASASAICEGDIIIGNADAVGKSFGSFFDTFNEAGGKSNVIQHRE